MYTRIYILDIVLQNNIILHRLYNVRIIEIKYYLWPVVSIQEIITTIIYLSSTAFLFLNNSNSLLYRLLKNTQTNFWV